MAGKRLLRLVHDTHVISLEGHHFSPATIERCVKQKVFSEGMIFREGKNLYGLMANGKLLPVGREQLPRGVNQRLRQSRLSPEEVSLIRRKLMDGERPISVAREFRISSAYVNKIGKGTRR